MSTQNKPASKWKKWHKIALGVILLIGFGIYNAANKVNEVVAGTSSMLTEPQKDSIQRKRTIEKGFSSWDGSNKNLVKMVKENMNDPKSFEHVDTKYWDQGTKLVVLMKYRGKNAFNAVVTNSVKVETDLSGTVTKLLSED